MTRIFIILLLFTAKLSIANEVDSLNTIEDVHKFLVEKLSKEWEDVNFFEKTPDETSKFSNSKFFKIDLDNNGLTDLLINGTYFFAITDEGNGNYESHFIGALSIVKYILTDIRYNNKTPLFVIRSYNQFDPSLNKTKTLIFKFGNFIEFNPTPDTITVQEIKFSTSGCLGTCPIFKLTINADRTANLNAGEYNDIWGKFTTTIDTAAYNNLIATINYIKLISLKSDYTVPWTDDQTTTLEIIFDHGKTKKISDYGAVGTFGLENLYKQLFLLRKTQDWK
jgi:hypothetical protein